MPSTIRNADDGYLQKVGQKFLDNPYYIGFMFFLTLWTLFCDSIKLCLLDVSADEIFDIIVSIAFFLFLHEISVSFFSLLSYRGVPDFKPRPNESWQSRYLRYIQIGSFYFWLDLFATSSLIFEVL